MKKNNSIYELAVNLSKVRSKVLSLQPVILSEVCKIYLFSFELEKVKHCKEEIFRHLSEIKIRAKSESNLEYKLYLKYLYELGDLDYDYYEIKLDLLKEEYSYLIENKDYDTEKERSLHDRVQFVLHKFCEELGKSEMLDKVKIYSIIEELLKKFK